MVPGMGLGPGFMDSGSFDTQIVIEHRVEKRIAPGKILAARLTGGVVDKTRPVCPKSTGCVLQRKGRHERCRQFDL
jgi:feruloyl esterase